jgi:dUTPase
MSIETTNSVKFFVTGDTNPPKRNAGLDAGFDLYVPNLGEQFIKDLTEKNPGQPFRWGIVGAPQNEEEAKKNVGIYLYLPAHEDIVIPTYVKARFADNLCLRISNKSGVATNQKLIVGAEIVDSSYQGIIHVHVFNASNATRFIEFGQKIAQAVPLLINNEEHEVYYDNTIEAFKDYKNFVSVEDFYEGHVSQRKEAGFGEGTGLK